MQNPGKKPVCVIIGVGPGNGAANAHKFASQGYALALVSRSTNYTQGLADQLDTAKAYACDVSDTSRIQEVFAEIVSDLGIIDVLIYSASSRFNAQGMKGNIEICTIEDMEKAWKSHSSHSGYGRQRIRKYHHFGSHWKSSWGCQFHCFCQCQKWSTRIG